MDKIYNIKYVDAYYSYAKNINKTKLLLHEAYGYIEKNNNNIVIVFLKESGVGVETTIKEKKNIIKGLIIPDTALVSVSSIRDNLDVLNDLIEGMFLSVTWRDVVYVANRPRYDCSIMRTEGVLCKIESDHIVIKNPKTIRTYPLPRKNYPTKKPNYYIIPISFVSDVSIIK
ncbi:hypothetical protein MNBD_BACTEROID04-1997 [hydrothermal vent metagenome]|uniref:Uncharacterized protein n=1 Tax=hydrothermal vent metagenome TaxID=652676 RepID=A0A3B0U8B8_9ZZZZ